MHCQLLNCCSAVLQCDKCIASRGGDAQAVPHGQGVFGGIVGGEVRWMGGGKVTELGSALPLSPGLHQTCKTN